MLSRHVGSVLHCATWNKSCGNRSLLKLICYLKPWHDLSFLFPFRNTFIGQTNETGEDEDEKFEGWKAGSETREAGARELAVDDTDMVNKDSMLICFASCLSELFNIKILERCKCDKS